MKTEIDNANNLALSGLNGPELCEGHEGSNKAIPADDASLIRPTKIVNYQQVIAGHLRFTKGIKAPNTANTGG